MEEQLEYSISLESLKLENFRCFDNLEIKFDEKLTVFIAGNGGGKTAILDAIAESLKAYLAALKVQGYEKPLLKYSDITNGRRKSEYDVMVDLSYPVQLGSLEENDIQEGFLDTQNIQDEEIDNKTENDVKLHVDINSDGDASFRISSLSVVASFENLAIDKVNKESGKDIILPVLCYYGGDSVQLKIDKENRPKNRLDYIYKEALSSSRINFAAFEVWFDKRYSLFLQNKVKFPELDMQKIDPNLFKIINAIEIILNDDMEDKMYKDLRMDYGRNEAKVVLGKQNDEKKYDYFEISQFSAGEKALFAFVADLGLRLLHATPLRTNVEDDKIGVINGKGIVLIDEVDLHLHPIWQRKVVNKLDLIFPDIQWVMTTHSVFVLGQSSSSTQRIYSLKKDNETNVELEPYAGGHSSDYIYSELMDIDPKNQDVEDYIALIRQGLHETAPTELQAIIDKLDPNSSDKTRINFAIQRLKSIGVNKK